MATQFELDKETILDSFGGDEELFVAMAGMFVQEADVYVAALTAAIDGNDAGRLQREAHTLKSLFATFADNESAAVARELEKRATLEALPGLSPVAQDLCGRLRVLETALRQELVAG